MRIKTCKASVNDISDKKFRNFWEDKLEYCTRKWEKIALEKLGSFEKWSDRKSLHDSKPQACTKESCGELWEHVSGQNEKFPQES